MYTIIEQASQYPKLWIDESGRLRHGSAVCLDPSLVDKKWRPLQPRRTVTGAESLEYAGRDPSLFKITEANGHVWWNVDDGSRLATLRDIDKVRREIAAQQVE